MISLIPILTAHDVSRKVPDLSNSATDAELVAKALHEDADFNIVTRVLPEKRPPLRLHVATF